MDRRKYRGYHIKHLALRQSGRRRRGERGELPNLFLGAAAGVRRSLILTAGVVRAGAALPSRLR